MRLRAILVVGVLAGLTGCPPPAPVVTDLKVSVNPTEVLADGNGTVEVTVSGAASGVTVSVRTPKGTWKDYAKSTIDIPGGNGTVTLVTCDSRLDVACSGTVRLTATGSDNSTGTASIKFLPGEQCLNLIDDDGDGKVDCADDGCLDRPCTLPGNKGTGTCDAAGACVCTLGAAEVCSDLVDNNCDAKIDCADPTCAGKICTLVSGSPGLCAGTKCACPGTPEAGNCGDGVDNDCDGKVDCADEDCQPKNNNPGGACDKLGNTCSPVVNGVSACTVCSGNGGAKEASESSCADGFDNDCNGKGDCQDPKCAGAICDTKAGKVCNPATLLCECTGDSTKPESICDDLKDDDCDGLADCKDPDCKPGVHCVNDARPNNSIGTQCTSAGACACSGNGGKVEEAGEESCSDGFDNDCDGKVDCKDEDCAGKSCGQGGKICSATSLGECACPAGMIPDSSGSGACICGTGAAEVCGDGADNNCDKLIDCADPTCAGKECTIPASGKKGVCKGTTCACPGLAAEVCDNGIDDDCNGDVDCADAACQPVGNNPGGKCDKYGNACSPVVNGVSTCTICWVDRVNKVRGESTESHCGDGLDNDCDGTVDCQDTDCKAKFCDPKVTSMTCDKDKLCSCPFADTAETVCNDLVDNNCDGKIDCADAVACKDGTTCKVDGHPSIGMACSGGACVCSGNGGLPQSKETNCSDGKDNDCNGLIDCADPNCANAACGAANSGMKCAATGGCACPAGYVDQNGFCVCQSGSVEVCDDGADNDCDGQTDCADSYCSGKLCTRVGGGKGLCSNNVCICPGLLNEICNNGMDDDCNGFADCDDVKCQPTTGFGAICDDKGNTCSPAIGGVSYCSVCNGNGGVREAQETFCGDLKDNDCNGKVDCQDANCKNQPCNSADGKVVNGFCNGTNLLCECPGGKVKESTCNDLVDDDCDGNTDCADSDCTTGAACKIAGYASVGTTCENRACVCKGNGGTPEGTKEVSCGDGFDNDCDGTADCADTDCGLKTCATGGKICNVSTKKCECPAGQVEQAGVCVCSAGTIETCDDGADNNCDGRIDCVDPQCNGKACFLLSGLRGVCVGGICGCPNVAEVCNDGIDNDCDGKADCDDSDCQPVGNNLGKVCDAKGFTCSIAVAGRSTCTVCSGNGGTAQLAESLCGDNSDNDCDGLVDCQDPDCGGLRCSATGMLCTAATKRCECAGGNFEAVADCADLEDNDCDGKVDCADSDCVIGTPCRIASQPSFGTKCAAGGVCLCSGNGGTPEASETTCSDGKDNDCDGKVDCADSNCQPSAPGASDGKYCSAAALGRKCDATGACVCPLGQTTESTCDDNLDNDCDGLADCQDPDCLNLVCSSTGKKCNSSKACVCPSGLTSEDNCMNSVDDDCDGLVDCADPNCANKQCNAVSTNFQCIGSPAICKDTTASYSLVLTALPTRIPADGLATSLVTATLRDTNGNAQAGKTVAFAVTTGPGGIAAAPPVPITDAGGKTNATYVSGTGAGPATVTASYNTGTSTVTGSIDIDTPRLGQVKFVGQQYQTMGVKYSSYQENNQLTFQVLDAANSPYPPGLSVTFKHGPVGGSTLVGETTATCTTTECTTTAKTLTGGYVSVNLVSGTVASVVSVTASATAGGGTGNATAGNIAIVGAKASGSHLSISCSPRNIPGFASHDCTNSLVNASITCSAAFADRFNNVLGVPTLATLSTEAGAAGPPTTTNLQGIASNFVAVQGFRLPVDVDPDSAQGEWYKAYDSGCGGVKKHNPRDGLSSVIVSASGEEGFVDGSNGCAANGVYDGPGSVCPGGDGKGEYFIDIGEPFIDANDNGKRDANEYYVDVNNNGAWDPPNGKWDGTTVIWAETRVLYSGLAAVYAEAGWEELSRWYPSSDWPPTSGASLTPYINLASTTSRMVPYYFADQNFNILVPQTAFNVYMITSSSTSVRSVTSPYVPDGLGVSLTQQFCSTSTGGSCSNACNAAPCYVVTTVSNFAYGNYGDVEVTRGNKTESWIVRASASLGGVSTFLDLPGGSACVAAGNNCNSGPDCCSGNCVTQPINDAGVPPKLCQ